MSSSASSVETKHEIGCNGFDVAWSALGLHDLALGNTLAEFLDQKDRVSVRAQDCLLDHVEDFRQLLPPDRAGAIVTGHLFGELFILGVNADRGGFSRNNNLRGIGSIECHLVCS